MDSFKSSILGKDSYVGRIVSGIRYVYNDINPATLTGAIDVIVVEQKDGSYTCGPFHVRFGKMGAFRPADKIIDIYLNGVFVPDLQMKLGSAGEAFFIEEVSEGEEINEDERLTYSPPTIINSKINQPFRSMEDSIHLSRTRSLETLEDIVTVPRHKIRVRNGSSENFVVCSDGEDDEPKIYSLEKNYHNNDYPIECLSDTEENNTSDNQRLLAYKSDSALNQSHVKEDEDFNMTWDWGNFPESISTNIKSKDDSDIKDFRNKSVSESDKSKEKSVDASKGIYLEDLVTENVDKDVKRNYIYAPHRTFGSNDCHKASSLDGLSSDGGYRSDGENSGSYSPPYPVVHDLKLSLCGGLNSEDAISMDHFIQHLVSYEEFLKSPDTILQDTNLVLSLNGKFYPWAVCGPMIVSMLSFQTQLPHQSLKRLQDQYLPKKKVKAKSWFPFGRQQHASNNQNSDKSIEPKAISQTDSKKEDEIKNKENLSDDSHKLSDEERNPKPKTYRKKIRLSSEEIRKLNLKRGSNCVEYKMTTKFQGTTSCIAHIYLWHWTDLIVISDVDGTITRSDVMGQLMPMLGRDWTQAGVARLYNQIASNEYRFVYLSARAIGQSSLTKRFLSDVIQEGSLKLPDGPVLLSPNSLLRAFHQEVIVKNPEVFKIQCMRDIRSLFPSHIHPLYSGFGNKPNDVMAYREVGIPASRNFIVNPQGVVKNQLSQTYSTNYGDMSTLVDYFFPYYGKFYERVQEDIFNDAQFWREPLPDFDLP